MMPMRFNGPQEMFDTLSQQDFIKNNPTKQEWLNTLMDAYRTGDTSKAEQVAMNICQGYGQSQQGMLQMVMNRLTRRG